MDNYRVTSRRGFRILSPPNRTSPFRFILRLHQTVPEMETLTVHLLFTPLQIRALFWSWLEGESLFLAIDIEFNFSGFDINVCICSAQERSPRMRGVFMSSYMSSTTKCTRIKKFLIFTGIFSAIAVG